MIKTIDIIARHTSSKTVLNREGNLSILLTTPSVVQIHGTPGDVDHYIRQGKDLLIYMKDGSVVRCTNYFVADAGGDGHSELVFQDDGQPLTHITFDTVGEAVGMEPVALVAHATPIASIEPFIEQSVLDSMPWGWIAGAALAGGGIGALLANDDGGHNHTRVIDNTRPEQTAKPVFVVSDDAGDRQGVLSSNALTDDTTPTFSGTGQPGSTIQIKNASGDTIASSMVASDGSWKVTLPVQDAGKQTYKVVQLEGDKVIEGGEITLEIVTDKASIMLDDTATDNVINVQEAKSAVPISGQSKALAQDTELTVTLNGKTYVTKVDADGHWQISVPASDAAKLAEGTHQLTVTGTDSTGNVIKGEQTLTVDTKAPVASINHLTDDNVLNNQETQAVQHLTGTTDAEVGQAVVVKLGDHTWTTTIQQGGKWSVDISAGELDDLPQGANSITVIVSDQAGNESTITGSVTVSNIAPTLSVNNLTDDNILNATEQSQVQILSGKTDAAPGSKVEITFKDAEGHLIDTVIGAIAGDQNWSAPLTPALIAKLGQGQQHATVTITDSAGNTISQTHDFSIVSESPVIHIDSINADTTLNSAGVTQPMTISGTTSLDPDTEVVINLNGHDYISHVNAGADGNNTWSVDIPVEHLKALDNTTYQVTVSGSDAIGNSVETGKSLTVDTLTPTITINSIAGDNLLGVDDVAQAQTLSGTVGHARVGDEVSVKINGIEIGKAQVNADMTWSLDVSSKTLTALGDGTSTVTATLTNYSGNSASTHNDFSINANLPGLSVDTVSGDDIINVIELNQDLAISGTSSHLAVGTVVHININGVDFPNAIVEADGRWQAGLTSDQLKALVPDGSTDTADLKISVTADDGSNRAVGEHGVTVDLNPVAISIDSVTGDDMINAAEKGAGITVTGSTQNIEAGQSVEIHIGDTTLTAKVGDDGGWQVDVSADQLAALADGRVNVEVSVANASGNSVSGAREVTVDTLAPDIGIQTFAGDNTLNQAEANDTAGQTLSGTSSAESGQPVKVVINGKTYQTQVSEDGHWSVVVPQTDLAALGQGPQSVVVTTTDRAGNESSSASSILVDTLPPSVTIDNVSADNIINQAEHQLAQVISGGSAGATAGDKVTVTLYYGTDDSAGFETFTTVLDASGRWSVGVPADKIQALQEGTAKVAVNITDSAGNTGEATHLFDVTLVAPDIAFSDRIAVDDVINAQEKGVDLVVTGTSNQPNREITVTLNGREYSAIADDHGAWQITVPPAHLSALGEANYVLNASVTDVTGNSSSASHTVIVDTSAPRITIDGLVDNDNVINLDELNAGQTLTGRSENIEPGQSITITVGHLESEVVIQGDGSWSLDLSAEDLKSLGDGALDFKAEATNLRGNCGESHFHAEIDADIPGIRIDPVTGDNVVNIIERGDNVTITGTATGVDKGADVNVAINGVSHTTTLHNDGTWSITFPAAEVEHWPEGELSVVAEIKDSAGNSGSWQQDINVDLTAVAITVDKVTEDGVINVVEQTQDLVLGGTTQHVEQGQKVTVTFGGHHYTAIVDANGDWTTTVPGSDLNTLREGNDSVTVSVSNVNGNTASAGQDYRVDLSAPTLAIDPVTGDNLINYAEARDGFVVTGQTDAEPGQTVEVVWNGGHYQGEVKTDGTWSVTIPAADLATAPPEQGAQNLDVIIADKAGNITHGSQILQVDTVPPVITIDDFGGSDNILNAEEHRQAQIISGSVEGAAAGDKVLITLENGFEMTTTLDAVGRWSVGVPATEVAKLSEGSQQITVKVTDAAGNSGEAQHDFAVMTEAPAIGINALDNGDVINARMKGEGIAITGTSNQPEHTITVSLNGQSHDVVTDMNGNWTLDLAPADLSGLGEAGYTITASVTDEVGNAQSASRPIIVDTLPPQVTIASLGDDVINIDESDKDQLITGTAANAEFGSEVKLVVGGKTFTGTVDDDGGWSIKVDAGTFKAFGDGKVVVDVTVTNQHGNQGHADHDLLVDLDLPGLRFDTVAGDDVVNQLESQAPVHVSGTTSGVETGNTVTLTVQEISGDGTPGDSHTYTAQVNADGSWGLDIPVSDASQWQSSTLNMTASVDSGSGNTATFGHQVEVDTSPVAISIDKIAEDDVLNAAERGQPLSLSGKTANVEAGQTVTIHTAGKTWTTSVEQDGQWHCTIPASDLAALRDGDAQVSVSVTNTHGNPASAEREFSVDVTAPTLSVEPLTADNVLNGSEVAAGQTLSGYSDAEPGQTLTVTFNHKEYSTTVGTDGHWSVVLESTAPGELAQGENTLNISVTDKAGNTTVVEHNVVVDTEAPVVTIDTIAGDDIINLSEQQQALVVTGGSSGAIAGSQVEVFLGDQSWKTQVDAQGHWSVGIPADIVKALAAGSESLSVEITDAAGNVGSKTHGFLVDNSQPSLSFDTIADDSVLNATEQGQALTISGSSVGLDANATVTVTLGTKNYTAQTDEQGKWSLTVEPNDLAQLGDTTYTVSASASSSSGNPATGSTSLQVDTRSPVVVINDITDDNILNKEETAQDLVVSGKVTGAAAHDTVYVMLAGKTYEATVDADLNWQTTIPKADLTGLGDGALTIGASVTNAHGNIGQSSHEFQVDFSEPGIRFDKVAGDDVINLSEHEQALVVTGTSDDLAPGSIVTLTVNTHVYQGVVAADGTWSATVKAEDVKLWNEGKIVMTAKAQGASGNEVSIGHEVTVDLAPVSVSIDKVTDDNVLNAQELATTLTLSGSTTGVEAGQTVDIRFAGKNYSATVGDDGTWHCEVPAADMAGLRDGSQQVEATVVNQVGNPGSASYQFEVDTTPPHLTVDPITADNVINIAEAAAGVTLTGTTDAPAGTKVTVTVNGQICEGVVHDGGGWSVDLSRDVIDTLTTGSQNYQVSLSDPAGNTAVADKVVNVDLTPPTLSFNTVAGDDIINQEEHTQAQLISGSTTGTIAGNLVVVTVGSFTTTTAVDAKGNWSVGLPVDVVSALQNGTLNLQAEVTDSAGNSHSETKVITVNAATIHLTVDMPAADGILNANEQTKDLTIRGTSSALPDGSPLKVTFNGKTYDAVVENNGWTAVIPKTDLESLTDGARYAISVSAEDSAGNKASADQSLLVDTSAPEILFSPISGDGIINAAEHGEALTIGGTTTARTGRTLTLMLNGKSYTATVQNDGSWKVTVPQADVALLPEGNLQVEAMVSDAAGNMGNHSESLRVDITPPTISFDTVAGDDIINAQEQLTAQTISGTTTAEAGQYLTVTLSDRIYTVQVGVGGSWSIQVPALDFVGLVDGKYTLSATVKDIAGNSGSHTHEITLNGAAPVIEIDTIAGDNVLNATERGEPLVITGTTSAPIGQTVTVTLNGQKFTGTVKDGGIWSVTVGTHALQGLADGESYTVHASVENLIGNVAQDDGTLNIDLTPPAATISIDSVVGDSGLDAHDFITNVGDVVLKGSLSGALGANEKAQISLDGVNWIDLQVNGSAWSYTDGRTLVDGNYRYQVRVIDKAGNPGATDSQTVTIDRVAPDDSQTVVIDRLANDTGVSNSDFITHDDKITLEGHLGAALKTGEHLQVRVNGTGEWMEVSVSGTQWSYAHAGPLANGNYTYQLRVIDDAGNVGQTAQQTVTLDTVSPDMGNQVSITHISNDSGLSDSDFVTSAQKITVHGTLTNTLKPDELVQISVDGTHWVTANTVGNTWFYDDTRTLADGENKYWVRVVDAAGNVGTHAEQIVVVDTIKPDSDITINITGITTDSGFDAHDYLTNDRSPTLHGELGAVLGENEYLQISRDGKLTWETVTVRPGETSWSFDETRLLDDGSHIYDFRIVDLAGNVSNTNSQTINIDSTAPTYGIEITGISDDTGQSSGDFITMDRTLTLEGTIGHELADGERVQINIDGTWVDAEVSGTTWRYQDSRELADGDHNYQLRIIDHAGNVGSTVDKIVTVDNVSPDSIGNVDYIVDNSGDLKGHTLSGAATDELNPEFHGVISAPLEEGALVELYRTGADGRQQLVGKVDVLPDLSWSLSDSLSGMDDGEYRYVVRVTDVAGNYTESDAFVYDLDTRIPTTVAYVNDMATEDLTPILTGTTSDTLVSNEYIEVKVNDKIYTSQPGGEVVVDPNHNTWYLQISDADTLEYGSYDVTAQVKSSAGNGNVTGAASGSLSISQTTIAPTWKGEADGYTNGMSYTLGSDGQWIIGANRRLVDLNHQDKPMELKGDFGNTTMTTQMDLNRDGASDVINARNEYSRYYVDVWYGDGKGGYTTALAPVGLAMWHGAVVAFDREGDGYTDIVIGDAGGPDSATFIWNNKGTLVSGSVSGYVTANTGDLVGNYSSLIEASGVDLNNDGRVDIVQHTYMNGSNRSMSALMNQGDGSFTWGFIKGDMFNSLTGAGAANNAISMTWADFDGDGNMDLFMSGAYGAAQQGKVMLNNGEGDLDKGHNVGATLDGNFSIAVDWNHDGKIDIIKLAKTGQSSLYTNLSTVGNVNFTESKIGSTGARITGAAAIDYDWDGAKDLLITRQDGSTALVRNTNHVADGTSLHVKIVDYAGINAFFGNTVDLYDSHGNLVSAQVLNAQSGIGVNDSSALLSFYGLDPNETYHLAMKYLDHGVVKLIGIEGSEGAKEGETLTDTVNLTWGDLKAGAATDSYVLSVDQDTSDSDGKFVGTGYNDTFFATRGNESYDGSGGTETWSEHNTWSATGGMDIVDFKLADGGVTVSLAERGAQDTGFNTTTLKNIEGLAGSDFDDVFTGNALNNQFEGRGGNDTFNIGSGGQDTLLYKLLDREDATGGNGHDVVSGFSVGTWEGTADSDRLDLKDLLQDSGYTANEGAHYINGIATMDNPNADLLDYLRVVTNGSGTEIQVDLGGTGSDYTTLVTLDGVQTDLATLLANHQLIVG